MKSRQVRAVVRREGLRSAVGNTDAIRALEEMMPTDGGKFMVLWEEQEIVTKVQPAECDPT